jgi:hypothetical protein
MGRQGHHAREHPSPAREDKSIAGSPLLLTQMRELHEVLDLRDPCAHARGHRHQQAVLRGSLEQFGGRLYSS